MNRRAFFDHLAGVIGGAIAAAVSIKVAPEVVEAIAPAPAQAWPGLYAYSQMDFLCSRCNAEVPRRIALFLGSDGGVRLLADSLPGDKALCLDCGSALIHAGTVYIHPGGGRHPEPTLKRGGRGE